MERGDDPLDETKRLLKQQRDIARLVQPLGQTQSVLEALRSNPVRDALLPTGTLGKTQQTALALAAAGLPRSALDIVKLGETTSAMDALARGRDDRMSKQLEMASQAMRTALGGMPIGGGMGSALASVKAASDLGIGGGIGGALEANRRPASRRAERSQKRCVRSVWDRRQKVCS